MPDHLKQGMAAMAGYPAVWLFSLLLHAIDADVNSVAGFQKLAVMPSVYGIAMLLFIPCLLAIVGFWARGGRAYGGVLLVTLVLIGVWLTLGGSTASTFWGYMISFSGVMFVSALFLLPGTIPAVLIIKAQRKE